MVLSGIASDRGMNSYAGQVARKKLNYLAADGVVETQPGSSAQTSQTTGRPTAAPTRVYPTPPPVSNPDDKETIEAVDGPTPGPIISQTATPAPTPQRCRQPLSRPVLRLNAR